MSDRSGTTSVPAARAAGEQTTVLEFLASGRWAGVSARDVVRLETHGAHVFLAGERVCKIKRPVRFPYMDFSTLERRRRACEAEVAVNRRTAPSLYLGAEPLVRGTTGEVRFGGEGEVLDWAVLMRRFPQEDLLDRMAEEQRLTRGTVAVLADSIARFHAAAERAPPNASHGGAEALRSSMSESLQELRAKPGWFAPRQVADLSASIGMATRRSAPILDRRKRDGRVRRCHGDLHLGNICILDGRPTLFDAIEFNEAFAWIDVLHDVAFVLMDLEHRRLREFANLLLTRYLMESGDLDGLGVLPILLADRALVRAKVKAATADGVDDPERLRNLEQDAHGYFVAAAAYLRPVAPCLVAVGGLSGTGKSTLAGRLAPSVGAAPGAVHVRSDVVRKRLVGVPETERLDETSYTRQASRVVYERMMGMCRRILSTGHSVVVDGVFARPEERLAVSDLARDLHVAFTGMWLEAPVDLLADRVSGRSDDASDATVEVVRRQATYDLGPVEWTRIDANRSADDLESAAKRILRQ